MQITQISPTFAVTGQLARSDLEAVARQGYRAVVNNRPDGEAPDQPAAADLEAEARRLGLGYAHIPIVPGEMSESQGRELQAFLATTDGPVLAFCRSGARSTALFKLAQQLSWPG